MLDAICRLNPELGRQLVVAVLQKLEDDQLNFAMELEKSQHAAFDSVFRFFKQNAPAAKREDIAQQVMAAFDESLRYNRSPAQYAMKGLLELVSWGEAVSLEKAIEWFAEARAETARRQAMAEATQRLESLCVGILARPHGKAILKSVA
ncbi:MAG: hypothetical protein WAX89_01550 [Alphaproteobacteria bacterium]